MFEVFLSAFKVWRRRSTRGELERQPCETPLWRTCDRRLHTAAARRIVFLERALLGTASMRSATETDGGRYELERAPLPGADGIVQVAMRERLNEMLRELCLTNDLASEVRSLLLREIPRGDFSIEHIAKLLQTSRRSLSRALKRKRTSFRAELSAVRLQLAERYLIETPQPLSEVSALLGFCQPESFHRWFKGCTGKTPNEFRQDARPQPPALAARLFPASVFPLE
jgi:AraC-like DNA-binding protein